MSYSHTVSTLGFLQKWTLLAGLPIALIPEMRGSRYPYYFLYILFGDCFFYGIALRVHFDDSLEVMTGTVYEIQIFLKIIFMFFNLQKFRRYLQMNDALLTQYGESFILSDFQILWVKRYKNTKAIYKKLLLGNTAIAIIITLPMYLLGKGEIALPGPHPFYNDFLIARIFYFFMDLFGCGFTVVRSCCMDMVCVTLILFHKTQLEHLKTSLEVVFEEIGNSTTREEEKKVVKKWTQAHKLTMRIIREFKEIIQPILFVHYLVSLVDLVVAFWTIGAGDAIKVHVKISALCAHVFNFATLGWQCTLLDGLENEHESMIRHMDYGQVLESPSWIRSFYLITCMRCRTPFNITALGFTQLSAPVFVQVLRNCFSLVTAVYRLQNRSTLTCTQSF